MTRGRMITCIAAVLSMILPAQLRAQQGGRIHFGNLSIIPGVELQEMYDDNIFRGNGKEYANPLTTAQEKKESDWITHAKPGLLLSYVMPERGFINLGYQGDFAFYSSNDGNNWKNHQGNFDVNYLAPGGLILGINELYTRAEDPYGSADQYNIGRVTKRWTNDLKSKIGYMVSSNFRSFLYFNNYRQKYANDIFDFSQDYTDSEYGVGVESRFLPKTWGFLRYYYGQQKYNQNAPGLTDEFNSDSTWHRVNTGLTWDADAKLSGELNVGYQWRQYDHEFTSAARTVQRDDKKTWIAATAVNFKATETTNLALSISRAVRNTASDTNEQFTDTGIGINLQQQLLAKLTLLCGLTYSRNDYNLPVGNERTDNNYLANVGLDYAIQEWMGVGVAYNYNRKSSNIETQEFADNQVMVSLKVVY
jgi:hypothetical protein